MSVVLDACFLIHLRGRLSSAAKLFEDLIAERETLIVPSVVAAEYLYGREDPDREYADLAAAAELADFTVEDAREAVDVGRDLKARGLFTGWNDLFIAGFARRRGNLAIITRNAKHFPLSMVRTY